MTIQRRRFLQATAGGATLGLAGCLADRDRSDVTDDEENVASAVGDGDLVLATTTSTYDSGLLDELHQPFEERFGVSIRTLSKGTGASIRTAADGDADVVLVHARGAEDEFLRAGHGVNRRDVMFNDFVVVGPSEDPAGVEGMESAADAFATVAAAESTFVSRGDDSGTHAKEQSVWAAADVEPSGSWYQSIGKGMGDALVHATEVDGYTLADRGTYLAMSEEIDLTVLVQGPLKGGPVALKNPYGVVPVNPAVHDVNYEAAMAYVGYLTGPEGQSIIDDYTANGSQLFFPNALAEEPNFEQYVPQGYSASEAASLSTRDRQYLYWVDREVPANY